MRTDDALLRLVFVAHYRALARRRRSVEFAKGLRTITLSWETGERALYFLLMAEAVKAGDL